MKHNEMKNRMKRILCAIAALCLLLGLVACGPQTDNGDPTSDCGTTAELTTERPTDETPSAEAPTDGTGEIPTGGETSGAPEDGTSGAPEAPTTPPATPAAPIELPEREL